MISRRALLVAGFTGLFSLALASPADAAPKKAKVLGGFDVADAVTDGKLKGVVKSPAGNTVFLLDAKLLDATPAGVNGVAGKIDGVLRHGTTGAVVAAVKGTYKGGPNGKGKLKALVLKPPATAGGTPTPIGKLKAKWIDANPVGTPGKFKGRAIFK